MELRTNIHTSKKENVNSSYCSKYKLKNAPTGEYPARSPSPLALPCILCFFSCHLQSNSTFLYRHRATRFNTDALSLWSSSSLSPPPPCNNFTVKFIQSSFLRKTFELNVDTQNSLQHLSASLFFLCVFSSILSF